MKTSRCLARFSLPQAKEKLISALQNSEGSTGTAGEARLEEARVEKEHLQAQLTNTLSQLERVRKDLQVGTFTSNSGNFHCHVIFVAIQKNK